MSNPLSFTMNVLRAALASLAALVFFATPALATTPVSPGINLAQLAAQVAALQNTVNTLQNTVNSQQTMINSQAATIQALQAKTAPISIQNGVGTNTEIVFTGVNVHIVNGLGATDGNPADPFDISNEPVVNGLGNLIIGYNTLRSVAGNPSDQRTGSHNLILGDGDNYSSFGGIIGGQFDSITGPYSSIITGFANGTFGEFAVVTSGAGNTAGGSFSVVTGGSNNGANGSQSVVTGGGNNFATGQDSVATSGEFGIASGQNSEVTGGNGNQATTTDSISP